MQRTGESRMRDVVATADRVLVVAGTSYDARRRQANEVQAEVRGRRSVVEVLEALACEDPEPGAAASTSDGCGPSLVFLEGRSVAATLTLVPPDLVRCPALWVGDARLVDPSLVQVLLADLDVPVADG